ncbi:MAG: Gfo/Idh/MocA family oxidoreductase [Balneolaceae bacterium]|nr:Gfo/Idh/MocA family oxidoreductase [Balneolaceae bacterium]
MKDQNRREFIKLTSLAVAGSMLPLSACRTQGEMAAAGGVAGVDPDYTLKLGLIGAGGRGTGAANQALNADPNVELVAVGDIFDDKMSQSLEILNQIHSEKVNVPQERQFIGFDAYQKVLDTGVDVVILATPPTFRPQHLEAAVDAGVHIFCEKPVAVDAHGYHRVMNATKIAEQKNLNLVSGFCWRYHNAKKAFFNRVLNGELGDITSIYTTYNTGELWSLDRKPEWSDAEYQLRNWIYYTWISGDHLVEQAIHSVDFMMWAMNDELPVSAMGTGGRQVRTDEKFGNVYDHFGITYEYESGVKGFHFCRQQANCENSYKAEIFGTQGRGWADVTRGEHIIEGENEWKFEGEENDMYQAEHDALFAAIRSGNIINQGEQLANSTMAGIMGRMAAYTGQRVTWDQAINSDQRLAHDIESWNDFPEVNGVAMPGKTPIV